MADLWRQFFSIGRLAQTPIREFGDDVLRRQRRANHARVGTHGRLWLTEGFNQLKPRLLQPENFRTAFRTWLVHQCWIKRIGGNKSRCILLSKEEGGMCGMDFLLQMCWTGSNVYEGVAYSHTNRERGHVGLSQSVFSRLNQQKRYFS